MPGAASTVAKAASVRSLNALRVVMRARSRMLFSFRAAMRFGYRRPVKNQGGMRGCRRSRFVVPATATSGRRDGVSQGPRQRSRQLQKLSELIRGNDLIVAPVALNPIMARMAEEAGFKAVYLSGGSLGWYKCVTEANITLQIGRA